MKKALSFLATLTLLLGLFPVLASADVITPGQYYAEQLRAHGPLLIAAAVILVAFILWRILRKKK